MTLIECWRHFKNSSVFWLGRWSISRIFFSHGAPRQLVSAPRSSFMPWGHCYFFFREVLYFDARLYLLPLQLWATVTEYHKWYSNKNFVPFLSLPDWKKLCKPSLIEPQARTNVNDLYFHPSCVTEGPISYFFFFPIAQFLLFKRCRKKSFPQAGFIFHCQWNISKANHISQINPFFSDPLVINNKIIPG